MNKEQHLLVILGEECAETAHRASKAIRFGMTDVDPEQHETAKRLLEREYAEIVAVAEMLGLEVRDEDKLAKRERVAKYMDYSREVGTLERE